MVSIYSNMWAWISVVYFRRQRKQKWNWNICNKITPEKVCRPSLILQSSCLIMDNSFIILGLSFLNCKIMNLDSFLSWIPFSRDKMISKASASSGVLENVLCFCCCCRFLKFLLFYYFTFSFCHIFAPTIFPLVWALIMINPVKKPE